jgi:hypothetical protein
MNSWKQGSISILVLLFGVVSVILVGGLIVLTATQLTYSSRSHTSEQALNVAEAGINYYKWRLARDNTDYTDGTGEEGSYLHEYRDPQGDVVGYYEIRVEPPEPGSFIVRVLSTGWMVSNPAIKRTIAIRVGTPSLAEFAFLHNSNVWFGQGMTIHGPVMTNGGIRMDGINTSTLSTTKETYTCGVESGCSEAGEVRPGIWGHGGPQELWQFPVGNVDFNAININFNYMKAAAQESGIYLPNSGKQGYHLIFKADGTVDVKTVNTTDFYKGWSHDYECENLYQTIVQEEAPITYSLTDKKMIFIEDTVWVEGTLNGQVTVVAAQFPLNSYQRDIWITNNLVYLDRSGAHKLGLIAQRDIIFAKDVPDDLEVNGALLSQSSRVLRHHYNYQGCRQGNPAMKNELTIYGAVISNLIAYWNFSGGGGEQPTSGFVKRNIIYDTNLYYEPPPYFPTSGRVDVISWNEVKNP